MLFPTGERGCHPERAGGTPASEGSGHPHSSRTRSRTLLPLNPRLARNASRRRRMLLAAQPPPQVLTGVPALPLAAQCGAPRGLDVCQLLEALQRRHGDLPSDGERQQLQIGGGEGSESPPIHLDQPIAGLAGVGGETGENGQITPPGRGPPRRAPRATPPSPPGALLPCTRSPPPAPGGPFGKTLRSRGPAP